MPKVYDFKAASFFASTGRWIGYQEIRPVYDIESGQVGILFAVESGYRVCLPDQLSQYQSQLQSHIYLQAEEVMAMSNQYLQEVRSKLTSLAMQPEDTTFMIGCEQFMFFSNGKEIFSVWNNELMARRDKETDYFFLVNKQRRPSRSLQPTP